MKKRIVNSIFVICFLSTYVQPTIIKGDPSATDGNTFSFNIGHAKLSFGQQGQMFWFASGQDLSSESDDIKKFGLSVAQEIPAEPLLDPITQKVLVPAAAPLANKEPATITTYNNETKKLDISTAPNPIYGAQFAFFNTAINPHSTPQVPHPAFVIHNALNKVYFAHEIKHNALNRTTNQRESITSLLLHSFEPGDEVKALHTSVSSIYAIHAIGDFGIDATSKLTFLLPSKFVIGTTKDKDGKDVQATAPYLQKVAEQEITKSTKALGNVSSLGTSVTMHTHSSTGGLYIGLECSADTGGAFGTMITTSAINGAMQFTSIAHESILTGGIDTIISANDGNSLRITNISSMSTSTSLPYLIVARDSGSNTKQNIYAVPLVSKAGNNYGKVADINSISNTFRANSPTTYLQRSFDTILTDPEQINHNSADNNIKERLLVGQVSPPIKTGNTIKDLYVVGDSVYIVISEAYDTDQKPGTFYSQAIFASEGHIISWTPWKRVIGSDEPTLFSMLSPRTTSAFYVSDTGTGFKKAVQTQWLPTSNLAPFFQASHGTLGGTQGIFDFPQTTPGFNNKYSLLITTAFNKVTIGQTGFENNGHFKIKPMNSSDVITFNNVNNSQAVIAAEIAHNNTDHWLFAGGTSGLAVLVDDNGITWNNNLTFPTDFDTDKSWKQVGNFTFIKKLIWSNTSLYILTTKALYRIELNRSKFNTTPSPLNPILVLEASSLQNIEAFLDCIIDNDFCILGTTNGMYSFNPLSSTAQCNKVIIPDGLPAISQLTTISNGSFKEKSNLYVLNNTFNTQQSRINRFSIQNGTIEPFNDALLNNQLFPNGLPTSFIKFNQYVTNYFTNGSWNLASSYYLGLTQPETVLSPAIHQLFANIHNGQSSSHQIIPNQSSLVPTSFLRRNDSPIPMVDMLLGIQQESTSGAFIITGNFEARVTS